MDFLRCTDELGQGNLLSMSYLTITSTVLFFYYQQAFGRNARAFRFSQLTGYVLGFFLYKGFHA